MSRLFLFNPDCELAIANGSSHYMPPANVVRMADDLALLPAYWAASGDCILVRDKVGGDFFERQKEFFDLNCQPVGWEDVPDLNLESVEPWGWSPWLCRRLEGVNGVVPWGAERKELYSRKKARECLLRLLPLLPSVDTECVPDICCSMAEIEQRIAGGKYVIKAPWSSSGRGILKVNGTLSGKEKEWLCGVLRRQGYVMVEKWLDKICDFAMEFYSDGTKVRFIGLSEFYTGENGEYKGNYIGSQKNIEKTLAAYVGEACFEEIELRLTEILSGLLSSDYSGYFGVDMMVYRNDSGGMCVQPCLEINLRYTMGLVALFLSRKYLAEGAFGMFSILFFPASGEASEYHSEQQRQFPAIREGGKIRSGYVSLTPVTENTCFVACIKIQTHPNSY